MHAWVILACYTVRSLCTTNGNSSSYLLRPLTVAWGRTVRSGLLATSSLAAAWCSRPPRARNLALPETPCQWPPGAPCVACAGRAGRSAPERWRRSARQRRPAGIGPQHGLCYPDNLVGPCARPPKPGTRARAAPRPHASWFPRRGNEPGTRAPPATSWRRRNSVTNRVGNTGGSEPKDAPGQRKRAMRPSLARYPQKNSRAWISNFHCFLLQHKTCRSLPAGHRIATWRTLWRPRRRRNSVTNKVGNTGGSEPKDAPGQRKRVMRPSLARYPQKNSGAWISNFHCFLQHKTCRSLPVGHRIATWRTLWRPRPLLFTTHLPGPSHFLGKSPIQVLGLGTELWRVNPTHHGTRDFFEFRV